MADYMNPFSGSQLPETVPNNPFASRYNQLDNQEMMAPFMQMEQQRQQLGIQQQQQTQREMMTPDAQLLRQQQIKQKLVTSQREEREAADWLAEAPEAAKLRVLKLKQAMSAEQGAPAQAAYKFLADAAQGLEGIPETARSLKYDDFLKQFKDQNPGAELPDNLKTYSPKLYGQLQEIRKAAIMTDKHVQELGKIKAKEDADSAGNLAVANVNKQGTIAAAGVSAASHERIAARALQEGKRNVGQMRAQQTAILNNPKSSQEEKETAEENLRSLATAEFANVMKADKALESMGITAIGKSPDSPEVQSLQKYQGGLWEKHLERMGVVVRMEHPTKKQRNGKPEIQLVPKSKYKEAKEAGFVEVK